MKESACLAGNEPSWFAKTLLGFQMIQEKGWTSKRELSSDKNYESQVNSLENKCDV